MKKRSEATQTLRAGSSKVDPQTDKHTNRQGRLQYTAQLNAQCSLTTRRLRFCRCRRWKFWSLLQITFSGRKRHPYGVPLTLSTVVDSRSVNTARGTNLPPENKIQKTVV